MHRITHIRRNGIEKNCQSITAVKVDKKTLSVEDVIKMMNGTFKDGKSHQFYITIGGKNIYVRSAPEDTPSYIRTERVDSPYDNLLDLPTF